MRNDDHSKKNMFENYRRSIEATTYYEIGKSVAESRHSLSSLLSLPAKIFQIFRRHRVLNKSNFENQQTPVHPQPQQISSLHVTENALQLLHAHGEDVKMLIDACHRLYTKKDKFHAVLLESARISALTNVQTAIALLDALPEIEFNAATWRKMGLTFYAAGNLTTAAKLLNSTKVREIHTSAECHAMKRICAESHVLQHGFEVPAGSLKTAVGPQKIAFICHLSLPYHTTGYAVRTHNLAIAIKELGCSIQCVTRPGYPWDRKDSMHSSSVQNHEVIDGVDYFHYRSSNIAALPLNEFFDQAATALYQHIVAHKITTVIAASNYMNALPALIAARKAGIRFTYDVRGLWEYSKASSIFAWEHSERFALARRLETLVAKEADQVIAISTPLKDELIARGVSAEKISIALNAVQKNVLENDPAQRARVRQKLGLPLEAIVLGYIGSIEAYEGLTYLMETAQQLILTGHNVFLLIVGDGSETQTLHDLACQLAVIERVRMIGRTSYEEAQIYYSAIDICVYPRLRKTVCELVAPLKPLEAMASKKPVVIAGLPAIKELLGDTDSLLRSNSNGYAVFVHPDDPLSLLEELKSLIKYDRKRSELAAGAYAFVSQNRRWRVSSEPYIDRFNKTCE